MIQKILNFKGLYGEQLNPPLLDFIHVESLESRSKLYNWEIQQHIHTDLYQIFVITSGGGTLFAGASQIDLFPSGVILIPCQIMHGFHFEPESIGYVLTIGNDYMDMLLKSFSPGHSRHSSGRINFHGINHFSFTQRNTEFNELVFIIHRIKKELEEVHLQKEIALRSCFHLLLLSLFRIVVIHQDTGAKEDQRMLQYYQSFHQNIIKSIHTTKSIVEYAGELNITTVHLNRICKKLVNKSALDIVNENLIMECKKYLLNTAYTISQISYLFNFEDPAYFTKVFKRMTGVTPKEFRK